MPPFPDLSRVVLIGVGATIVMDIWLMALTRLGTPRGGRSERAGPHRPCQFIHRVVV